MFVLLADYRWVADGSVKSLLDDWQQADCRMAGYRAAVDRLVECRWEAWYLPVQVARRSAVPPAAPRAVVYRTLSASTGKKEN